jgi:hypothetical protein
MAEPNDERQELESDPRSEAGFNASRNMDIDAVSKEKTDTIVSKDTQVPTKLTTSESKKGWLFWMILVALSFTSLLTSMEATITSTALPSIIADLGGGDLYVWAANGYFLTM